MIAYLWNLIVGQFCNHKWETMDRIKDVWNPWSGKREDNQCLRCTKCGIWKSVRL